MVDGSLRSILALNGELGKTSEPLNKFNLGILSCTAGIISLTASGKLIRGGLSDTYLPNLKKRNQLNLVCVPFGGSILNKFRQISGRRNPNA